MSGLNPGEREGAERATAAPVPEIAVWAARGNDLWIFAYGSLMWDPGFAYDEAVPAMLRGYHRRFCVYSHGYRGTPERPGLVLGLDRGGSCKGVAYRVPAADVASALEYLWRREMQNHTYRLKELPVALAGGVAKALAFVVNRDQPSYAGRLGLAETARLIHQGVGARGPCRQYLENTVRALQRLGMIDGPMHRLERRVRAMADEARAA